MPGTEVSPAALDPFLCVAPSAAGAAGSSGRNGTVGPVGASVSARAGSWTAVATVPAEVEGSSPSSSVMARQTDSPGRGAFSP